MNLTSSAWKEKEIEVTPTVKVKIDLAFNSCRIFKKRSESWVEKENFSISDMTLNEFIAFLENLEEQALKDEAHATKYQLN